MVVVAQLVRASDCGSEGRGFESHHPPESLIGNWQLTGFQFYFKPISAEGNPDGAEGLHEPEKS
jgi:hypothetical protein